MQENDTQDANTSLDTVESPKRRDMIRRLAKAAAVVPVAAVIYNASTTVAAAED